MGVGSVFFAVALAQHSASTRPTVYCAAVDAGRTNEVISKYLPPKYDILVFCSLTPGQKELYDSTVRLGQRSLDDPDGSFASSLVTINNLRKICGAPELLEPAAQPGPGAAELGPCAMSGKLLCLINLLRRTRATTSDRFVLISNFTSILDVFQKVLRDLKQQYVRLDGSAAANKRQQIVDKFNPADSPYYCFLLSSKACGCGINLIGANRLVLYDPDWNPACSAVSQPRDL